MSKRTEDLEKQIATLEKQAKEAEANMKAAIARLDVDGARAHLAALDGFKKKIKNRRKWLAEAREQR